MKLKWEKLKLWCFHNWRILVIVGAIVLAYVLGGKKVKALQTQLQMARELYKKRSRLRLKVPPKRKQKCKPKPTLNTNAL